MNYCDCNNDDNDDDNDNDNDNDDNENDDIDDIDNNDNDDIPTDNIFICKRYAPKMNQTIHRGTWNAMWGKYNAQKANTEKSWVSTSNTHSITKYITFNNESCSFNDNDIGFPRYKGAPSAVAVNQKNVSSFNICGTGKWNFGKRAWYSISVFTNNKVGAMRNIIHVTNNGAL